MNPLFHIDLSISDSLKIVRKSVLIYETIIEVKNNFARIVISNIIYSPTNFFKKTYHYL